MNTGTGYAAVRLASPSEREYEAWRERRRHESHHVGGRSGRVRIWTPMQVREFQLACHVHAYHDVTLDGKVVRACSVHPQGCPVKEN